uniref:Uncharacterized protein n=1 Tax=Candidatus Kentrum eta TaxID=2126337 RepID=A0A450V589_9GAMM|nr:MAG: hypothetical protein BECKH772B_GA0070898_100396 [Candidatus Kentron sp. H]VFJ99981.1 MAG: hypothetical protein BECKH772C_GA0070978_100386 [Candidatus Kentron sp. H]
MDSGLIVSRRLIPCIGWLFCVFKRRISREPRVKKLWSENTQHAEYYEYRGRYQVFSVHFRSYLTNHMLDKKHLKFDLLYNIYRS